MVTTKSLEVSDYAYAALWYKYPLKYQIIIKLAIQYANRQYNMSGYGLTNCNLASFGKVKTKLKFA